MPFDFRKVLVLGATSGIGRALASKFISQGVSVIAVGRREDRLQAFATEHRDGSGKVDTAAMDMTAFDEIPKFAQEIFARHPDLDCVFLNAGMQRQQDWTKPDSINLDEIETELKTNYTACLHLAKAFLPLLMKRAPEPAGLMFTTSGLALVPHIHAPNYSSTKAALHATILVMREQLRAVGSNVKIIEIYPPMVQTELHNHEHGEEKGSKMGMPLDDFVDETWEGLSGEDNEQVFVQMARTVMSGGWPDGWEAERQKTFAKVTANIRGRT